MLLRCMSYQHKLLHSENKNFRVQSGGTHAIKKNKNYIIYIFPERNKHKLNDTFSLFPPFFLKKKELSVSERLIFEAMVNLTPSHSVN